MTSEAPNSPNPPKRCLTPFLALQRRLGGITPQVALVLGSGLGGLADQIESARRVPYEEIPNFARGTAAGHRGELVAGLFHGVPVVAMAGRLHRYEGWSLAQVTYPIEVLAGLGASALLVSNAAGGLRHHFQVGEIMVIRDHINWLGDPPEPQTLAAATPRRVGATYDSELAEVALAAGRRHDFGMHQGTYLATLGPTYETRAEYRMMRRLGADCVGMSTVPEVIAARRCGMRVLALSMISNVARPDAATETTHDEVLDAGKLAAPRMAHIATAFAQHVASNPV